MGTGWRAEPYLRLAAMLPERFAVTGIVAHSAASQERARRDWGVEVHADPVERPARVDAAAGGLGHAVGRHGGDARVGCAGEHVGEALGILEVREVGRPRQRLQAAVRDRLVRGAAEASAIVGQA